MNGEDASTLRGAAVRGVVHRVDDAPGLQQVDVETHEGVVRSGVEVLLPYGLASHPAAGGLAVLLAVGGDQGDQVALPVASPAGRIGGLAAGEVALYDDGGNRVHIKAGGQIEIHAATSVLLKVGGTELRVTAAGVEILGNLSVIGTITATGDVAAAGVSLQSHVHGGVQAGASITEPPEA